MNAEQNGIDQCDALYCWNIVGHGCNARHIPDAATTCISHTQQ